MIRINLLGQSKQKKQHAAAATMEVGDVGTPRVKVLVILVVALLINAGWWYQLDKQKQDIATQMQAAEQKNRELADVKIRYLERQRQAQNYKRRVDVIDQLRKNQMGPSELLNALGDTVNGTEAVWLSSMKDQGASVDIEGMALSADAVANLISNLQKSGQFRNVEIKETFQDDTVKDMQAFAFTLTCEKGEVLRDGELWRTSANYRVSNSGDYWCWVLQYSPAPRTSLLSRAKRPRTKRPNRYWTPKFARTPSSRLTAPSWPRSSVSWPALNSNWKSSAALFRTRRKSTAS